MPPILSCFRPAWFALFVAAASTCAVAGTVGPGGHDLVAKEAVASTAATAAVEKAASGDAASGKSASETATTQKAATGKAATGKAATEKVSATIRAPEKVAEAGPATEPAATRATPQLLVDPMERLRQRLAEKLAARRAQVGARDDELQVITKAPAAAVVPAASVATSVATSKTPSAGAAPVRHAAALGRGAAATAGPKQSAAAPRPTDWSYGGSGGPDAWATVEPEYAACGTGRRQSPIDIKGGIQVDLEPVHFDYRPGGFSVLDTGHTVQVNTAKGNAIEVLGRRYELVEFHFHRPSESLVDGKRFDMEVQLTHKDAQGRLAVVAVLLDQGGAQPVVQTVWNNLPLEAHADLPARALLDPAGLLPAERGYFTYLGSLTNPPCTGDVLWMVMKQPVSVSQEQIAIFEHLYPMNARPVQAAGGRLIKGSN